MGHGKLEVLGLSDPELNLKKLCGFQQIPGSACFDGFEQLNKCYFKLDDKLELEETS